MKLWLWGRRTKNHFTKQGPGHCIIVDLDKISNIHVVTTEEFLSSMTNEKLNDYEDRLLNAIYDSFPVPRK